MNAIFCFVLLLLLVVFFPVTLARGADRCDELVAAATSGDVPRLTELADSGLNINCRDPLTSETALMDAAINGKVDAVKFLLERGADPNVKSAGGQTALDMVRAREAAFSKIPNFADLATRQREAIALLVKSTAEPDKPVKPVEVEPADPDLIAKFKLEGARAALMAQQYASARDAIQEVIELDGVSDQRRAQAFAMSCDLSMREKDWGQAKTACEKVLEIKDASEDDRFWSTDTVKTLRKFHPELFKDKGAPDARPKGFLMTKAAFVPAPFALPVQEKCPSAEACLSTSLERNWTRYYGLIEQAWADRKKIADLLRRAEALNRPDVVTKLKEEQSRIEERWQFADAVARALTSPRFKQFTTRKYDEAVKIQAAASERARKETALYKRLLSATLGPERESVSRDIQSYAAESHHLQKMFYRDGVLASGSALKETVGATTHAWTKLSEILVKHRLVEGSGIAATLPYVITLNAMTGVGYAGFEAVHSGLSVQEAKQQNTGFEAFFEATRGTAAGTLRMIELFVESPDVALKRTAMRESLGAIGARTVLYANVIALGLDTALTVKAMDRLNDAEARQLRVETDDAHWRARVDVAARAAHDAALRATRAQRQVEQLGQLEQLYASIRKAGE